MKKQIKKHIIPFAAVASLTFGTTAASAVEVNEANEHYNGVIDWTEEEWNSYLDTNHGSSLSEYDSVNDLETDVGAPVDVNELGNSASSDANILDIIERYNLDSDEIAAFLAEYDSRDNIHFVGDLENALESEGFTPNEVGEEDPVNQEGDDSDRATDTPEQNNDSAETLDQSRLEEVYLTPLGWTADEFSTYLEDNYDRTLNDFTDFEELQSTAGPVLTDENQRELLDEYSLTPEEFRSLLNKYGEEPGDYHFVNDLDDALDYYTSGEAEESGTENGAEMPETATDSFLMIAVGVSMSAVGAWMLLRRRFQGE